MSSHSALGGHVVVEDFVNVGWGVGVHQFCRLGSQCMVSACSKLVQDVPPYMLADGSPAEVRSINKIGLERNGFSKEEIEIAKSVFRILYRGEYNRKQAIEHLENGFDYNGEKITKEILDFTKKSDRGLA
jgi:UDP-N-acetylglucosamine acyltransferase